MYSREGKKKKKPGILIGGEGKLKTLVEGLGGKRDIFGGGGGSNPSIRRLFEKKRDLRPPRALTRGGSQQQKV